MTGSLGIGDRLIRALAGFGLIGLAISGLLGWWAWIGLVGVLSAALNWCPVRALRGVEHQPE